MDALDNLGVDAETSRWVIGSVEQERERGKKAKDRIKKAWDNLKLYGKGGKAVKAHVNELYSPPRVNSMVERMGLIPGMSLDLTTNDPEDNLPWDFNRKDKRDKAEAMVKAKSSLLLVVSPMCAAFSRLQRSIFPKMSAEKCAPRVAFHLRTCL